MYENPDIAVQDNVHPVVIKHPVSGRHTLFVNPGFTFAVKGMDPDDSANLLKDLFEHSTKPGLIYTHEWQPHDLLCWDNRSVMHRATHYDTKHVRHMHRTTIEGGEPF